MANKTIRITGPSTAIDTLLAELNNDDLVVEALPPDDIEQYARFLIWQYNQRKELEARQLAEDFDQHVARVFNRAGVV